MQDQNPKEAKPVSADHSAISRDAALNQNVYFSDLFARQIQTQRVNVIIATSFALVVLFFGFVSSWYLFQTNAFAGTSLEYVKLGPIALTGISLPLPLRMFLSYRIRSPIYRGYKQLFEDAVKTGSCVDSALLQDARAAIVVLYKTD